VDLLVPAVGKTRERNTRHLADLRGTLLLCALELHLARNGAYPATLAELSPDPLTALPVTRSAASRSSTARGDLVYILYSVGPDMTDNGGLVAGPGDMQGDIVFSAVE